MDITRIDKLIAERRVLPPTLAPRSHGARPLAPTALDGTSQRRRCSLPHRTSFRAPANGARKQSRKGFRPLLHGRARHPARKRHRLPPPARTEDARIWRRTDRQLSAAATTRWIATIAGSASRKPTARWFTATPKPNSPIPSPPFARATKKASPMNSSCPP